MDSCAAAGGGAYSRGGRGVESRDLTDVSRMIYGAAAADVGV